LKKETAAIQWILAYCQSMIPSYDKQNRGWLLHDKELNKFGMMQTASSQIENSRIEKNLKVQYKITAPLK